MQRELTSRIDSIFERYQSRIGQEVQAEREREAAEQAFAARFCELRDKVIRPALEDIKMHVERDNCTVVIKELEVLHCPLIGINFYPAQRTNSSNDNFPGFAFIGDKQKLKVRCECCTVMPERGGRMGTDGFYDLSEISTEFVQEKVTDLLEEAFG